MYVASWCFIAETQQRCVWGMYGLSRGLAWGRGLGAAGESGSRISSKAWTCLFENRNWNMEIENSGPGSWDIRLRIRVQMLSSNVSGAVETSGGNWDANNTKQTANKIES